MKEQEYRKSLSAHLRADAFDLGVLLWLASWLDRSDSSKVCGQDERIGTIEPGKLADLAVIGGNPLQDLRSSDLVRYTVLNGRIYEAATMDEIGNHPKKRGKFFWEE